MPGGSPAAIASGGVPDAGSRLSLRIMFAACHVHEGEREAWVDVILGSLRSDDASDHVTFGARVGPVAGQADPAATAVPAAAAYSRSRSGASSSAATRPWRIPALMNSGKSSTTCC